MSTATFSVKAYASRNEMFHSRNMALKVKGDWEGPAMQADEDVAALPAILQEASDEELEKWRKMTHIYKDQHVAYDEDAGQYGRQNMRSSRVPPRQHQVRPRGHLVPPVVNLCDEPHTNQDRYLVTRLKRLCRVGMRGEFWREVVCACVRARVCVCILNSRRVSRRVKNFCIIDHISTYNPIGRYDFVC